MEIGYRHIDTAQAYFNEKEVEQAIKDSGIPREEIFVTSKLWIQDFAYETAKAAGKIKSIGVSNFTPNFWKQFVPNFATMPAVNQVEFNPYFQQKEIRDLLSKDQVIIEAWAPLGQGNKDLFEEPVITELASKYGKDVGQIILRFENQEGIVVLPKSTKKSRAV